MAIPALYHKNTKSSFHSVLALEQKHRSKFIHMLCKADLIIYYCIQ